MRPEPLTGVDVDHTPTTHPGLAKGKPGPTHNGKQKQQTSQLNSSRKTKQSTTPTPES
jgi:hypothetical protein